MLDHGFAGRRNYLIALFGMVAGLGAAACSSDSNPDEPASGGSTNQAGTAGVAQTGGSPSAAGSAGAPATGGTATSGSSTGGSATAGTTTGGASSAGAAGAGTSGAAGAAGGGNVDPSKLEKFSFFVTSMAAMQRLAKSQDGFGGDLTYGTGDGLMGADKICTEIAESSMPGAAAKEWHAFLSTKKGPVHAKDRIGPGPWYDRTGRLVAMTLADLLNERPVGAADAIYDDLPNELGIGNHRPDPNKPADDNHHTLTGSNTKGELYTDEGNNATCLDWTTKEKDNVKTGRPRIGFSWAARPSRVHWISGQTEGGCGAGVTGVGTVNGGSDPKNPIVGSGGGYGGIYCFAMVP